MFRPDGTLDHVCATAPDDFPDGISPSSLTVTDTGEVYVDKVHFAADGTRLERSRQEVDPISQERYAQRGSDRFWIVGYKALYLIETDGALVRKIERTPDGQWLRGLDCAAVRAHAGETTTDLRQRGDRRYQVEIAYGCDVTRVLVRDQDGRVGNAAGPQLDCCRDGA